MSIYDDVYGACVAIEAQLESYLGSKGVVTQFGYMGEGHEWPMSGSTIRPCVVVELPDLARMFGGTGITGEKNSMQVLRFNLLCVGPTAKAAVQTMGLACDAVVGYTPISGGGEIRLIGSALGNPAMQTQTPTRYAIPVGFQMAIGAIVVS